MSTLEKQLLFIKKRENGPLGLLRKKAKDRLEILGLPHKKTEAFQYMPLLKLYSAPLVEHEDVAMQHGDIAFHNGCFLPKQLSHVEIMSLEEGMKKYSLFLSNALNTSIQSENNPFVLLNTEKHEEGAFLYIPPNTVLEKPLVVTQLNEIAVSFTKLHVLVGRGSSIKIAQQPPKQHANSFAHISIHCVLEEGAHIALSSASDMAHAGWYFESVRIVQKRDSKSTYYAASKGGVGTRYDAAVTLAGPGSDATLLGVHELREKNECHTHLLVTHEAPHCTSNQQVKYGLFDAARSSFEGKIYVEKEAQKTDAYQLNSNLLLGDRAKAYSKPNLEIFADDVKASHGSTIGQLHEDELFYLQTRGLSSKQAKELLVAAFFEEIYLMRPFT